MVAVNGAGWLTRATRQLPCWWDKWIVDGIGVNGPAILARMLSYPVRMLRVGTGAVVRAGHDGGTGWVRVLLRVSRRHPRRTVASYGSTASDELICKITYSSIILFTPLVGALLLLFVPKESKDAIRWIANIFALAGFLISLPLVRRSGAAI